MTPNFTKRELAARFAILLVAAVVVPFFGLRYLLAHDPELGSKPEWSVLQAFEAASSEEPPAAHITLRQDDGRHLLGVPSAKTGHFVWVLLDPKAEPFYKQMPLEESFILTPQDLRQASSFCSIHSETLAQLHLHVVAQ